MLNHGRRSGPNLRDMGGYGRIMESLNERAYPPRPWDLRCDRPKKAALQRLRHASTQLGRELPAQAESFRKLQNSPARGAHHCVVS